MRFLTTCSAALFLGFLTLSLADFGQAEEELFVAKPLTKEGDFTPGIEGPACDAKGNLFVVNYGKQGTIGRVTPAGKCEVYVELPNDSVGNGIRFDRQGTMYVADYVNHNVLSIDPESRKITKLAHNAANIHF